jgi:hypothetical protein
MPEENFRDRLTGALERSGAREQRRSSPSASGPMECVRCEHAVKDPGSRFTKLCEGFAQSFVAA